MNRCKDVLPQQDAAFVYTRGVIEAHGYKFFNMNISM